MVKSTLKFPALILFEKSLKSAVKASNGRAKPHILYHLDPRRDGRQMAGRAAKSSGRAGALAGIGCLRRVALAARVSRP
jgi:hypothetical protein